MRLDTRLWLVALAGSAVASLVGCATTPRVEDLRLAPRPALRGIGPGDAFDPGRFPREKPPTRRPDGRILVEVVGKNFFADFVLGPPSALDGALDGARAGEALEALTDGAKVELLVVREEHPALIEYVIKTNELTLGEVVGVVDDVQRIRRTNLAGVHLGEANWGGMAPDTFLPVALYLGPEELRASGLVALRETITSPAEMAAARDAKAKAERKAKQAKAAASAAYHAQAAERELAATRLSAAEEARLTELRVLANEADRDYQAAVKIAPDWRSVKAAIYSALPEHLRTLEVEEAARARYMGVDRWSEWYNLEKRALRVRQLERERSPSR